MDSNKVQNQMMKMSAGRAAVIAGIALLIMTILAPIANFSIIQGMIVPEDAAKTVSNISESEGLFRLGIVLFVIVALLDIIVAWALYLFLKSVNRGLSLLAAWLRVVYAAVLAVVLIHLIDVLHLLSGTDYLAVFSADQLQVQIMISINSFNRGWEFGLILFGFHLLLLGYLLFRAGYMRKILGILVILAALGYLIDSTGKLLSADYDLTISLYTFVGEIVLIFWLLIIGRKKQEPV